GDALADRQLGARRARRTARRRCRDQPRADAAYRECAAMRDAMRLLAAALAAGEDEGDTPRPITEAIVDELQAVYRRYNNGCSFRPGDFVAPSTGAPLAGAGQPHIVL